MDYKILLGLSEFPLVYIMIRKVKLQFIDFIFTDITSLREHKVLFQDCQDALRP